MTYARRIGRTINDDPHLPDHSRAGEIYDALHIKRPPTRGEDIANAAVDNAAFSVRTHTDKGSRIRHPASPETIAKLNAALVPLDQSLLARVAQLETTLKDVAQQIADLHRLWGKAK